MTMTLNVPLDDPRAWVGAWLTASYVFGFFLSRWLAKEMGMRDPEDSLIVGAAWVFAPIVVPCLLVMGVIVGAGKLISWGVHR